MSVFRIELRRTIAPWLGLAVLAVSLGFLFLLTGPWWHVPAPWTAQTTTSALWVRYLLQFLWPLAIGAGAIQGMRDHRSGMTELLESMPRPAWHRFAKLALAVGAMALLGYLAVFGVGVVVAANHGLVSAVFVPHVMVALLALLAGAWLGLAIGRLMPHPLTAPAVAVVAFALIVVLWSAIDGTWTGSDPILPARIAMLGPALTVPHGIFATTATSVDVGQAIWFTGLALTGFALLSAKSVRSRLAGLLPVALAAAVAVPIFPASANETLVPDSVATQKVCDGPVCVTKMHEASLPAVRTAGKEALRLLAKLPDAPTRVEELTDVMALDRQPHDPSAVYINFQLTPSLLTAPVADLRAALLAGAGAPECLDLGRPDDVAARTVSAAWFTGELKPLPRGLGVGIEPGGVIEQAWQRFRQLPEPEQVRRMAAMRHQYLACTGNPLQTLVPGLKP